VKIRGHGIEIDLPPGWEGLIYRRPGARPILHAGNFGLPIDDGDFGTRAVPAMGGAGVFLVLAEFDPATAGVGLFRPIGVPLPLRSFDASPRAMPRVVRRRAGIQRFFTERGRAFELYVVVGTASGRAGPIRLANEVLSTLRILPP
jgi:hypothetical protein